MFELMVAEPREHSRERETISWSGGVRVVEVMTRPQPIVPSHICMGAARKIAQLKSVDALIVEERGSLVGFLDSQVLRTAQDDRRVADCLTPIPSCLNPTTTLARARELLIKFGVQSLPVAAGPFLVGSISRSTVERSLASAIAQAAPVRAAA